MPFKYAYVKYRDSTECEILETDVLENFDESLHLPSKCYWVTVRCSSASAADLGDHRYKVQILLLAETRAKITEMLEQGTRLKIPKIYDSSISSQEESDVEMEDETGERGQKRDVEGVPKKLKQKTLIADGAKKKALSAIMKDKLVKRTPFAPFITPPTLPPKTPRPQTTRPQTTRPQTPRPQTPRPQTTRPQTTTKNPRPKPTTNPSSKTPHTQTTTPPTTPRTQTTTPPKTPRTQTTTPTATQIMPTATQIMTPPKTPPSSTATIPAPTNSEQRIQALEQRVRVLEALNVRLQEEILNKFAAGGPGGFVQDTNSDDKEFLGLDYQAEDGQISLGHGVSLAEEKYTTVKGSTTNSLFVKNLAIAVWGSETLRDSSLEGKTCPRFKNRPAKQRLDADKLLAVKECFSHHLAGQPLSPSDRKAELAKFKTYIREKMMDLNRRKK